MNLCLTAKTGTSRGTQAQLDLGTSYNVYLGGYSGVESQHRFPDVTNDRYDGCMRKLKLGSNGRDLSDNLVGAVTLGGKNILAYLCWSAYMYKHVSATCLYERGVCLVDSKR